MRKPLAGEAGCRNFLTGKVE